MLFLLSQISTLGFATVNTCGCLGNMDKAEQQSYYPNVMGDSCHAWDAGMDYCQPGGSSWDVTTAGVVAPGAASWCYDPWCYVKEGCPGAAAGSYFTAQTGPTLFYSYTGCGATDTYTGTAADPATGR